MAGRLLLPQLLLLMLVLLLVVLTELLPLLLLVRGLNCDLTLAFSGSPKEGTKSEWATSPLPSGGREERGIAR